MVAKLLWTGCFGEVTPGKRPLTRCHNHVFKTGYTRVMAGQVYWGSQTGYSNGYSEWAYLSVLNFDLISHVFHAYSTCRPCLCDNPTREYVVPHLFLEYADYNVMLYHLFHWEMIRWSIVY